MGVLILGSNYLGWQGAVGLGQSWLSFRDANKQKMNVPMLLFPPAPARQVHQRRPMRSCEEMNNYSIRKELPQNNNNNLNGEIFFFEETQKIGSYFGPFRDAHLRLVPLSCVNLPCSFSELGESVNFSGTRRHHNIIIHWLSCLDGEQYAGIIWRAHRQTLYY